jgi:hypothetical protein
MVRRDANMTIRQIACLTAVAALAGCALWDQNTFQPPPPSAAPKPVAAATAPPMDPREPLLTIGFGTPDPAYQTQLAYVLKQVRERRPGAVFDVVGAVPAVGDAAQQALAAGRGSDDAVAVARAMMALGVADRRIHLGARAQPGLSERQVLVYLR